MDVYITKVTFIDSNAQCNRRYTFSYRLQGMQIAAMVIGMPFGIIIIVHVGMVS